VAGVTGISKSSVQRYSQAFNLKPHRVETFKLSTDPLASERPGAKAHSSAQPCL